jgi:predicted PurR-regulated permease PerM
VKLVGVVIVVGVLYLAQDVLKPLAVAALLSFLLAPLVRRLERFRLRRAVAVMSVVTVVFALIGLLGWVVAGQVVDLADRVSDYRSNIRAKIQRIRDPEPGALDRASEVLEEIEQELAKPPGEATPRERARSRDAGAAPPMPVTVTETPESPVEFLRRTLVPLLGPVGAASIVVVFVIFMLLEREDLRDRLIRLVGTQQLSLTTAAMDEAASRVSRYLLLQLVVNVTYGIPVGVALYLIGVPNALLWGLLAVVLRYIPYLGPWIAAALPILLSFAVFPGWARTGLVVGLFVVLEILSNNFVEPWLYGSRIGVAPVALLVAAVFWTWLWGPVGLMLAAPLTVCLVVVGRHVPQLEFLTVLFGDEPPISPAARLYQRLLARDAEEAVGLVQNELQRRSLVELFDDVLVAALSLAEQDRHQGVLDPDRERYLTEAFAALLDEVSDTAPAAAVEPAAAASHRRPVVCVPARDEADALVASMLAMVLERQGIPALAIGAQPLAAEMLERVASVDAAAVCISALPPLAVTHARYLAKRLRARFPELPLVVGIWNANADLAVARQRLASAGAEQIATTLAEASGLLVNATVPSRAAPETAARAASTARP